MSASITPKAAGKPIRRRNGVMAPLPPLPEPTSSSCTQPPAEPGAQPQAEVAPGQNARITARLASGEEIDLTRTLVAAIAHALWQARGEDHLTNWFDAEAIVNQIANNRPAPMAPPPPRAGRSAGAIKSAPMPDDDLLPAILRRPARTRRL